MSELRRRLSRGRGGRAVVGRLTAIGTGLCLGAASAFGQAAQSAPRPHAAPVTGLAQLILDIYRHNLVLYGLTVVAVMVLMGVVIGYCLDFIIKRTGIDLGKLEHRE